MLQPLVSICIPTYNGEHRLPRAIESLLKQTYRNYEIIVSDNASTDNTEQICKNYNINITYYKNNLNIGPTANFNLVRNKAKGKYFMWLGDDDWIDPRYIESCVEKLELDCTLNMVSGVGAYHRDELCVERCGNVIDLQSNFSILRLIKYLWMVEDNSIFYGIYRMDKLNKCFIPNIIGGDWAWLSDVILRGKTTIIKDIFVHRMFGQSDSSSYDRLVRIYGLPFWNSKLPRLATAIGIFAYLRKRVFVVNPYKNILFRYIFAVTAALVVLLKSFYLNGREFLSKITFIKRVYKYSCTVYSRYFQ